MQKAQRNLPPQLNGMRILNTCLFSCVCQKHEKERQKKPRKDHWKLNSKKFFLLLCQTRIFSIVSILWSSSDLLVLCEPIHCDGGI